MMIVALKPVTMPTARAFSSIRPTNTPPARSSSLSLVARATPSDETETETEVSTPLLAFAAIAIPFELLTFYSEYTVVTTGDGLQGDVLGGLEGLGYLAVLGMVALSVKSKVSTGSGLPAGPGGVVGASEGLAFLGLLGFAAFAFHS
jgi:hypothetical protein